MAEETSRDDLTSAIGARRELGNEYEDSVVDSFVARLDQRIADTLRERAEGAVDTDLLTARAVGAGRARRRRRRVGASAALGLVALLGLGVATGGGLPVPARWPHAAPAAPPPAPDAPVAAVSPELVGSDAGQSAT